MARRSGIDRSRRDFARIFALGGSAALFAARPNAWSADTLAPASPSDERGWQKIRDQFVMPPDYVCLNAANLCPSPVPVFDALTSATRLVDRDPSSQNRRKTHDGREALRRRLASCLRVTPEEIVITRRGKEVARLVPSRAPAKREFFRHEGLVVIGEDFDDPLPEDIQAAFEGRGT